MSDAANAATRNLYPRAGGQNPLEYKNGSGKTYNEQLVKFSWSTPESIPAIGQKSAGLDLPELREHHGFNNAQHYLHPTRYNTLRRGHHLSYAKTNDELGILWNVNPKNNVHDRLYLGSKVVQRPPSRSASSMFEMAADVAFQCVEAEDAVPLYSKAIKQTPCGTRPPAFQRAGMRAVIRLVYT